MSTAPWQKPDISSKNVLCQCNILNAGQMDELHSVYSEIYCSKLYLLVKQII